MSFFIFCNVNLQIFYNNINKEFTISLIFLIFYFVQFKFVKIKIDVKFCKKFEWIKILAITEKLENHLIKGESPHAVFLGAKNPH